MRVTPGSGPLLAELEQCCFLPALFSVEVSATERQVFALPLRFGGLGVSNPVDITKLCFDSSVQSTAYI